MKMWTAPSLSPRDWAAYAINTYDGLARESLEAGPRMMSSGLHLRITGRPGRIGALEKVLEHVQGRGDAWVATRPAIAGAHAAALPATA